MTCSELSKLFTNKKIVICVGTGGVGKTTVAAAMGVLGAEQGLKTLVLTLDPARRLANSLGIVDEKNRDVPVPLEGVKGSLFASMIDPKKTFDDFIKRAMNDNSAVEKIFSNKLYQQMSTVLSGSQEFTAIERLFSAVESKKYDLIILDTPPSEHAIDFLTAPERIINLFQDSFMRWFKTSGGGLFFRLFNRGTQKAFSVLEQLTGRAFMGSLFDFFESIQKWQPVLLGRTREIQGMLKGPDTTFVLVTGFDELKIQEAVRLNDDLRKQGYRLSAVVVNRFFPQNLSLQSFWKTTDPNWQEVWKFYVKMRDYYQYRITLFDEFVKNIESDVATVKIPEFNVDVHKVEGLREFGAKLVEGWEGS